MTISTFLRLVDRNFRRWTVGTLLLLPPFGILFGLITSDRYWRNGDDVFDASIFIPVGALISFAAIFFWLSYLRFNRSQFGPAIGSLLFSIAFVFFTIFGAHSASEFRMERDNAGAILGILVGIVIGALTPKSGFLRDQGEGGQGISGGGFHPSAIDEIIGQPPIKVLPDGTRIYSSPMLDGRIRITTVKKDGSVTYAKAFPPPSTDRPTQ